MLQRLQLKLLWLRHSYPFRWAHKPLCDRFEHDVLRVGHVHICRSCTCAYLGMALVIAAALAGFLPTGSVFAAILLPVMLVTLAGSHPRFYWRFPRGARDVLRLGAGASIALTATALLRGEWILSSVAIVALSLSWRHYKKKRGGRKSQACDGCPELGCSDKICSGFSQQAARIRRYEERAASIIAGKGVPEFLKEAEEPVTRAF